MSLGTPTFVASTQLAAMPVERPSIESHRPGCGEAKKPSLGVPGL